MEPAVCDALQSRLAALYKCVAEEGDMFARWWASGQVLEVFQWGLVPGIPARQDLWECVRQFHYEALVDVFGADSAEVSRALRETYLSFCLPSVCSRVAASTFR